MSQKRLDLDAAAGDLLDQWDRVQAPPVAVHVLGEPVLDRGDLAMAEILIAWANLSLHCLP